MSTYKSVPFAKVTWLCTNKGSLIHSFCIFNIFPIFVFRYYKRFIKLLDRNVRRISFHFCSCFSLLKSNRNIFYKICSLKNSHMYTTFVDFFPPDTLALPNSTSPFQFHVLFIFIIVYCAWLMLSLCMWLIYFQGNRTTIGHIHKENDSPSRFSHQLLLASQLGREHYAVLLDLCWNFDRLGFVYVTTSTINSWVQWPYHD